jgi:hypothetical protein
MDLSTLSTLSLVDLKKLAKGRRIKQYYIMKRAQLIQILSLSELPRSFVLEKKTIIELRQEAKQRGMRGFWRMSREEILSLLYPDAEKDNQNQTNAEKHHEPKSHDSKYVRVEVSEDPLNNWP